MTDRYYVKAGNVRPATGVGTWEVAIRFTVPGNSNSVSTPWTVAAAEHYADRGSPATEFPGEDTTLLAAGTEVEIQHWHKDNVNKPGLAGRLEASVATTIATEKAELADELGFWGKTAVI